MTLQKMISHLLLGMLVFSSIAGYSQGNPLTVEVSKNTVEVGESFIVKFKLRGDGSGFQQPRFEFFQVTGSGETHQNIVTGNKVIKFTVYSFRVRANKAGNFEIGPASAKFNGQTVKTKPVTIKVKKPSEDEHRKLMNKIKKDLFFKCIVDNRNPYKGEQITVTYKLYIGRRIEFIDRKTPQFNGFWKEELKIPKGKRTQYENINGKRYKTYIISKFALFPQKTGSITIEPWKSKFKVRYKAGIDKRGFLRRYSYKTKTVDISSNPVTIDVKPLPDNQPASFNGFVGNFELNSEISKKQTTANNSITLKLAVSGRGNLNMIQPFELNLPPVFESYSPNVDESIHKSSNYISGVKRFEYLLIPRSAGRYKIAPVKFTYFNPDKEKFETLTTPKYTIRVNPGVGGPETTAKAGRLAAEQNDVQVINEDIRYIRSETGNLGKNNGTFVFSASFWGLMFTPVLLLVGMIAFRNRSAANHKAQNDLRANKARKLARKQLRSAKQCMQNGNEEGFYEALSHALWGYAGDKMNIPTAEMTQDHIRDVFRDKGIEQNLVDLYLNLLNDCEQARYAPSLGNFDMNALYRKAEEAIQTIERQL